MNSSILTVSFLLFTIASAKAQTAVLFGASGAVGSEVLKSLIANDYFQEIILIGRKSYPKVDEILNTKKAGSLPNLTTLTLPNLADLDSYEKIDNADSCFLAVGVGDINKVTLEYWHSIEVDLIGSMARFCDKIHVRSLTLLSMVDAAYESATPIPEEDIHAPNQGPLGWVKSLSIYPRVKGLEEKSAIANAKNVQHIRLFQPSTIVTQETRYGWVDRFFFFIHGVLDPYIPQRYRSVDVSLLGAAMVSDAEQILNTSVQKDSSNTNIAKITNEDYKLIVGEAFEEKRQNKTSQALECTMSLE